MSINRTDLYSPVDGTNVRTAAMHAYLSAISVSTKNSTPCSALSAPRTSISENPTTAMMNGFSPRCIGNGGAGLNGANAIDNVASRLYGGSPCSWRAPLSHYSARTHTYG